MAARALDYSKEGCGVVRYLALIIFVALSATQTHADDNSAKAAMGSGMATCDTFAQMYAKNTVVEEIYFQWAQGFMTGMNVGKVANTGTIRDLNSEPTVDQMAAIRQYCNDHPRASYQDAVVDLFSHFKASRYQEKQ
jgi:hypothetical protein